MTTITVCDLCKRPRIQGNGWDTFRFNAKDWDLCAGCCLNLVEYLETERVKHATSGHS